MKSSLNVFILDDHETFTAHLKRSILSSFMGTEILVSVYPSAWQAIENCYVEPDVILLDHMMGEVNAVDSIPMLRKRFPLSKLVVLSTLHDIKEFSRALANGADRYVQKNQWTLKKVNVLLKEYMSLRKLETKGFLIKAIEKTLGMHSFSRLAIVESDNKLLFSLHYRLTKTLNMRIDAYESLERFYATFKKFPDVMVLSDRFADTQVGQSDILRLKTLKPGIRLIMMSSELSDPAKAEELMGIGLDGFIYKEAKSFDLIEKMIGKSLV